MGTFWKLGEKALGLIPLQLISQIRKRDRGPDLMLGTGDSIVRAAVVV